MKVIHEDSILSFNNMTKWNLQAAFYMAIKNNRADIVENLLKNYRVDVDTKFGANEQPAVTLAVECGHADVLKCLLDSACSVNQTDKDGETPLHRAVIDKRLDLMRLLLAERAKSDVKSKATGATPFHLAVDSGRLDVLQTLTSLAVDKHNGARRPNNRGVTPLLLACANGLDSMISHLVLDCNLDVDVHDSLSGNAPLHYILKLSQPSIDLLLEHGAKPTVRNYAGMTPLHVLAKDILPESLERVELKIQKLLQNGANLESRDKIFQRTPLHLSIVHGSFWLVKLLTRFNASIEIKDRQGRSPIYYAAKTNDLSLLESLLILSSSRLNAERWITYPTSDDNEIRPETLIFLRNYKKNLPNSLKFLSRSVLRRHFDEKQVHYLVLPIRLVSYVLGDEF